MSELGTIISCGGDPHEHGNTSEKDMGNKQNDIDSENVLVRELPTYRPVFWFELPEGPKRETLRLEQAKPGYKHFNR